MYASNKKSQHFSHHIRNQAQVEAEFFASFPQEVNCSLSESIDPLVIDGLGGYGKRIWNYFMFLRNRKWIRVRYKTIADRLGCNRKTVQRWVSRFVSMGLLYTQRSNRYSPYNFAINKVMKKAVRCFMAWFLLLSGAQQWLYSYNGIKPHDVISRPVPQRKNLILNNNIFIKPLPLNPLHKSGYGVKRGRNMVTAEQRAWIQKHKNDGVMKEEVIKQRVIAAFMTPLLREVEVVTGLDQRTLLKLLAYPEEVVHYALSQARYQVKKGKVFKRDIGSWFMGLCKINAQQNKVKPDWPLFYDVCEFLDIDHMVVIPPVEQAVVVEIRRPVRSSSGCSMYDEYIPEAKESSGQRMIKLELEIKKSDEQLANPRAYFPFLFLEESIDRCKMYKKSCENELEQLRSTLYG